MKPFSPEPRASARLKPFPVCGGFFSFSKLLQESAFWFVSLVFFVFAGVSEGCNTPVFRYALEHWPASDYRFVVLTEGKPPQELKQKVEALRLPHANLKIEWVDAKKQKKGAFGWGWPKEALPYAFLKAPELSEGDNCVDDLVLFGFRGGAGAPQEVHEKGGRSAKEGPVVWEGSPSDEALEFLCDSPARRKVAEKILAGESAVFLVVERGSASKMLEEVGKLGKRLKAAERTVALSQPLTEGKISKKIPLQMKFSVLMLSASDPKEKVFIAQLMQLRGRRGGVDIPPKPVPDLWEIGGVEPVVVPVIGRGRAVAMLRPQDMDDEEVRKLCGYIAGPCSCEVKRQNPGADLLFAVDWVKAVEPVALKQVVPASSPASGLVAAGGEAQNAGVDPECKLTCLEPLSEEKKPRILRTERKPYEKTQ